MTMQGINPQALHYTYIISGDRASIAENLLLFIESNFSVETKGNPDFFFKEYESFYINDARDIQNLQQNKTLDNKQFFVLSMREMTYQAQNAFLKVAEDPSSQTCFFFILPSQEMLLPTFRSRAVLIEYKTDDRYYEDLVKSFAKGSPKERLDIISPFHPKEKGNINKEDISKFLSTLELAFSENITGTKRNKKEALHDIYDVKKKLQATGVSVKTLLEHLAVVLPFQK